MRPKPQTGNMLRGKEKLRVLSGGKDVSGMMQDRSLLQGKGRTEDKAVRSAAPPVSYRLCYSLLLMIMLLLWITPVYRKLAIADPERLFPAAAGLTVGLLLCGLFRLGRRPAAFLYLIRVLMLGAGWLLLQGGTDTGGMTEKLGLLMNGELLLSDLKLLFTGQSVGMSPEGGLLLLLTGWSLLVYSVQRLALAGGGSGLFSAATLAFLLFLHYGPGLQTAGHIAVAAGTAVMLRALSLPLRHSAFSGAVPLPKGAGARRTASAGLACALLAGAAWAAVAVPDGEAPAFRTLRHVLQDRYSGGGDGVRQRLESLAASAVLTGYGGAGRELGSPLTPSRTKLFYVYGGGRDLYLRGESLDTYDGRSWTRASSSWRPLNAAAMLGGALRPEAGTGEEREEVRIELLAPAGGEQPLFAPPSPAGFRDIELADGSRLGYVLAAGGAPGEETLQAGAAVDAEGDGGGPSENGKRRAGGGLLEDAGAATPDSFRLPPAGSRAEVVAYTAVYNPPESDPARLRQAAVGDPQDLGALYTALPDSLPPRIGELAGHLTGEAKSRHDAAEAVMHFLQSRYTYTLDTAVPPPGTDFADEFLFMTGRGYCVHFATAMTVLLRSAGIPARYVQGFAPGQPDADALPPRRTVTSADAHAWTEVYFPGAGWVPFDPTPPAAAASALAAAEPAPPPRRAVQAIPPAAPPAGGPPAPALAAPALLCAAAWRWRRALALLPAACSARPGRARLLAAGRAAWRGLAAAYGPPPPGMTGREYADSLPTAGEREAVRRFVRQWEALVYASAPPGAEVPPGPPEAGRRAASAFVRDCLRLVFRLA